MDDTAEEEYIVYILFLEHEKFYIGQTTKRRQDERMKEHFLGGDKAAAWTRRYHPLPIPRPIMYACSSKSEVSNKEYTETIKYMYNYGIDQVRGHMYCEIELSDEYRSEIERRFSHDNGECFLCGGPHLKKHCPNRIINRSN